MEHNKNRHIDLPRVMSLKQQLRLTNSLCMCVAISAR